MTTAPRHEYTLFLLAGGALGRHIADDNFFPPAVDTAVGGCCMTK